MCNLSYLPRAQQRDCLISCLLSEETVHSSLSIKAFFWSTLIYKSTGVSRATFVTLQALCQTGVILLHKLGNLSAHRHAACVSLFFRLTSQEMI